MTYKDDIFAWSNEQAALLRSGKLSEIDIEHIADEIESVGKRELRNIMSLMAELIAQLLVFDQSPSSRKIVQAKRIEIEFTLKSAPSLWRRLSEDDCKKVVWSKALALAASKIVIDHEECPWTYDQVLNPDHF